MFVATGGKLRSEREATDLIGEALGRGARLVAIPVDRFEDDFFRPRSGLAGSFLQKFLTYGIPAAIVGDISRFLEESSALRDFVYESNRGGHILFVNSVEELESRADMIP
jgi:hypothetical protein